MLPPSRRPMGEGDALRSLSRLLRYVGRTDEAMDVGHEAVAILESQPPGRRARTRIRQPFPPLPAPRGRRRDGGVGEAGDRTRRRRGTGLRAHEPRQCSDSRGASGVASLSERSSSRSTAGLDEHAGRALVASFWWSPRGRRYGDADRYLDRTLELLHRARAGAVAAVLVRVSRAPAARPRLLERGGRRRKCRSPRSTQRACAEGCRVVGRRARAR